MMVDDKWIQRVVKNLVALSEEKTDFKKARQEWIYLGLEDNQVCDMDCQLCDHEDIRYEYRIKNINNSNEMIVGSSCIEKFVDYLADNRETMKDTAGAVINKARVSNDKKVYWAKLTSEYLKEHYYSNSFQMSITDKVEKDGKLTIKQAIYLKEIYEELDERGKTAMRNTVKIRLRKYSHQDQYYKLSNIDKEFINMMMTATQIKSLVNM